MKMHHLLLSRKMLSTQPEKINYTCTLIIRNHHVKIQKIINISRELGHEVVSGQPDLKRSADALLPRI
jgi:hypothetical protein